MRYASVLDIRGNVLSPCPEDKAHRLISSGKADLVTEDPLVIRLRTLGVRWRTGAFQLPAQGAGLMPRPAMLMTA